MQLFPEKQVWQKNISSKTNTYSHLNVVYQTKTKMLFKIKTFYSNAFFSK